MSKSFVFTFAAAVLLLTACHGTKAPKDSTATGKDNLEAKIEFDSLLYDLGLVNKDTLINKTFIYHNTGKGKLLLDRVNAHCGCTIVAFSKVPTEPGDSAALTVALRTEELPTGFFNKLVDVYSNGSEKPITLSLRGELTRTPY